VDLSASAFRPSPQAGADEASADPVDLHRLLRPRSTSSRRVARSRLAGEPADVLITPILSDFATMDFHRAKEAIEEGRAAVARMGPLLEQVLG
jgi:predicted acylesterase/phospholipase RssA